ncbi:MAG: tRNA lysidine(34) synthetase TilS [Acidobacteria bacterium]|nr:tRNA lysidine(34) synthetase TilS [Acidobacteriota bacterium]
MRELALETIREFRMIQPGEAVAAGCSGGADSTALVLLLKELSDSLGCVLSVAHLNHCLRGSESDADEQFVRSLAERLGVPCFVERADVGKISRQSKTNPEAKARELRLRFFESLMESGQADSVALAHTADDQAETVLQRLLRGAGTRGLTGIHPVMKSPSGKLKIIRPLIRARRAALREWLTKRGEGWREDLSNQDRRRTRNRIRHEVLPLLEEFNPRIVEALAHTAAIAREEEAFWESYLQPIYESWVRWEDGKATVDLECLSQAPSAVAYRVLRWVIGRITEGSSSERVGQPRPTDFLHIQRLYRWSLEGQSGQEFSLPQKVEARKEFSHLILERLKEGRKRGFGAAASNYCYPVEVPCTVKVTEIELSFRFEFVTLEEGEARYNEQGSILLDAKLAESPLSLRNWQPGDAYRPAGHRSPKKLQDLFQRRRIPVGERIGWPVLWAGERIVWARGLAVATGCSPSPGSHRAVGIYEIC